MRAVRALPPPNLTLLSRPPPSLARSAFLTLFRVSTGENWQNIAADCKKDNAYGSPVVGTLFFFSFTIICQYITLNLFIAVLLDNFNLVKKCVPRAHPTPPQPRSPIH